MSEIGAITQFLQGVADEIGYTGAAVIVIALLALRNHSKMVQAFIDSNRDAAKQRSEDSKQDAGIVNGVLSRQTTILDEMSKSIASFVFGIERLGSFINVNSVKQDELLDEFRTHESAALHRHEASLKAMTRASEKSTEATGKAIKDAHVTTRQGVNHLAENVLSTSKGMQGVNLSMANLSDRMEKSLTELRELIEARFSEVRNDLAKLVEFDNRQDIQKAVTTIETKLTHIEELIQEGEQDNGND